MLDSETVIRSPHDATVTRRGGKKKVVVHDPRVSVSMKARGCELVLFFADSSGEGPVLEVRLLPDSAQLEPHTLRSFVPQSPQYVSYARAALAWRDDDARTAMRQIRAAGMTRRGLGDDLFKIVAASYATLLAEGEPHPVKALGEMYHVTISTASRWLKEARRRGLIEEAGNDAR